MAPTQTWRKRIFTSGRYLKIMANRREMIAKEAIKLSAWARKVERTTLLAKEPVTALMKVVRAKETSRRKPVPSTMEKEMKRCRTSPQTPPPGLALTSQIVFRE